MEIGQTDAEGAMSSLRACSRRDVCPVSAVDVVDSEVREDLSSVVANRVIVERFQQTIAARGAIENISA